jgi:putative acetyltransferase
MSSRSAIATDSVRQINLIRCSADNPDFQKLVGELDQDLRIRDGAEHEFFAAFNKTDQIKHVVVAYLQGLPLGCGAMRAYNDTTIEIKRMYVQASQRGLGIGGIILKELEKWAGESGFTRCILETGKKQPEAIALYKKHQYHNIPNYGPYEQVESSVCFEKILN